MIGILKLGILIESKKIYDTAYINSHTIIDNHQFNIFCFPTYNIIMSKTRTELRLYLDSHTICIGHKYINKMAIKLTTFYSIVLGQSIACIVPNYCPFIEGIFGIIYKSVCSINSCYPYYIITYTYYNPDPHRAVGRGLKLGYYVNMLSR